MGDSITQGGVKNYNKKVGEYVELDEIVAYVETDKITIDIRSPEAGELVKLYANEGDNVEVGKPFFEIETDAKPQAKQQTKTEAPQKQEQPQVLAKAPETKAPETKAPETPKPKPAEKAPVASVKVAASVPFSRNQRREPMSRIRQRIAQRLKDAQNTYALLTTFNECDMSAVMTARETLQKDFQKKHGVKLGFMSFFVKATVACLQEIPIVNAVIDGNDIIHRDFCDISVAVATPNGLMVPVLRNCESKSFAQIEKDLLELADKGKNGKITPDDMAGGTFTISNGGVFGSMMGTPIINAPQSAILGMHAIINRPVVRDDQIVARPMMYVALTYDHRIMDGREAATFLKKLCTVIEDPRRLLLEV